MTQFKTYGDILAKMQEMMADLQEMRVEENDLQSENVGANHRSYSPTELEQEAIRKSEQDALTSGDSKHYNSSAPVKKQLLTYTGKFEKDENGEVKLDEQVEPVKEMVAKDVNVEYRNYNEFSTSINDMKEEEKLEIQRRVLMNIHASEDKITINDIRTRIVNDKIEFVPRYSEEEEKRRFKFTRINEVDETLQVPLCKFYINEELIYTMDVEKQVMSNPLMAIEHMYRDVSDEDKMDEVDRLCHEIYKKTQVDVHPEELFAYLDSGYLINGPLDQKTYDV